MAPESVGPEREGLLAGADISARVHRVQAEGGGAGLWLSCPHLVLLQRGHERALQAGQEAKCAT